LQQLLSQAQQFGNDPSMFAPVQGQTTQSAIQGLGALGQQPSFGANAIQNVTGATTGAAGTGVNTLQNIASGANLNNNPYLDQALHNGEQDVADTVNRQFSGMGRYGSAAHTGELTRQLSNYDTGVRANQYAQQQGQQQAAAGTLAGVGLQGAALAPQAAAAQAQQLGYGLGAGQLQDQFQQQTNLAPYTAAQAAAGLTVPIANLGGTSDSTSTATTNPSLGMQILGGAGLGLGLLSTPFSSMGFGGGAGNSYLGNLTSGAPLGYGNSWAPWVQR